MTENVNGLQVDISKYVGEEIARLAVASIGEDTLKQLAEKAIKDLYEQRWFGTERATTIHRQTAKLLSEKIQEYVVEILEHDDFKEQAKIQAEQIVSDMQKKSPRNRYRAIRKCARREYCYRIFWRDIQNECAANRQ